MEKELKEIEILSSKIHDLYMAEIARQGQTRANPLKYEDLDENTREFDRVIARFVSQAIQATREETVEEIDAFFKDHYWDGLQDEKELLLKHWKFIVDSLKAQKKGIRR